MTANVGITERADRLVAILVATGLDGLGVPYIQAAALWLLAVGSTVTVGQRVARRAAARRSPRPRRDGTRCASRLTYRLYAGGWALVRRLPERPAYGLFDLIADLVVAAPGRGGDAGWRPTCARARPDGRPRPSCGRCPGPGMRSYLRYWCDAFRLPDWSRDRVVSSVRVDRRGATCAPAPGRGRAAWSAPCRTWATGTTPAPGPSLTGVPVITVAERLQPERALRPVRGLPRGPRHGGPAADRRRAGRARRPRPRGCAPAGWCRLLADRDLRASGVEVELLRRADPDAARPGAAGAAHRRGAAPGEHLARGGGAARPRLVIRFHDEVRAARRAAPRGEKVTAMTQQVADVFGAAIAEHPADWHMLQPLWLDRPRPGARPPADRDRAVKVGIVCPYSWDVPGGVQFHVRDLAEVLIRPAATTVSVLAPADDDTPLPPYVVPAGRAVPVPLQRLGGPGELRPAVGRPGAPLAARGRASTCCTSTSRPRRRCRCSRCWAATGADRGDLPHLQPAVAGDERRVPDPASRRWRRSAPGSRCPRTPGAPWSSTSAATPC